MLEDFKFYLVESWRWDKSTKQEAKKWQRQKIVYAWNWKLDSVNVCESIVSVSSSFFLLLPARFSFIVTIFISLCEALRIKLKTRHKNADKNQDSHFSYFIHKANESFVRWEAHTHTHTRARSEKRIHKWTLSGFIKTSQNPFQNVGLFLS